MKNLSNLKEQMINILSESNNKIEMVNSVVDILIAVEDACFDTINIYERNYDVDIFDGLRQWCFNKDNK